MTQPRVLLCDVIEIPERTSTSDLVLDLNRGVEDTETTVREYTVTDRLLDNFEQALNLIRHAAETRSSKAAYLHGSFGSGKSHFMAVLHALLDGNVHARRKDEFAGLLAKHSAWLDGKRFLLVTSHLMGSKSLEQRVCSDYIARTRQLRPDASMPAVHRTDGLLEQAAYLRREIGDDEFIARLPGGTPDPEDLKWGRASAGWTGTALDEAFAAPF